ncbi:hypothetical protein [Desulfovibrio sp. DV]|uniref:hypothetical protein n=1 Tax=Desulfovibrio sp. DV TaxID=1844708 RepID=UPI000B2848C4|nr:hypothetical protein [Desulfovibrio sp. DV]
MFHRQQVYLFPFFCFFCLVMVLLGRAYPASAETRDFEIQCLNSKLSDCMDKFYKEFGWAVSYPQALANVRLSSSFRDKDPVAGLRSLLQSIDDSNYALSYDEKEKTVQIFVVGASEQMQQASQQPKQSPLPSKEQIATANKPPNLDMEFRPGITYRELKAQAERIETQKPSPDTPFLPNINSGPSITWGELQKRQQQIDSRKPREYSLPNGNVSSKFLNEQQARVDQQVKVSTTQVAPKEIIPTNSGKDPANEAPVKVH